MTCRLQVNNVLLRCRLIAVLLCISAASAPAADNSLPLYTGPWNLAELKKPPAFTWGRQSGLAREVYYAGELFHGKPPRVFAYYACPEGPGPFPAMLLVHGGSGQTFLEWANLWASRGYAALAMDLKGQGPDRQLLPDGGPDLDDPDRFHNFSVAEVPDMWPYHGVAAVLRGHSLLASLAEVDRQRVGITGISWGGYVACIASGIDDRLKVSVPVYGCGFLYENSAWKDRVQKMEPESRSRWIELFDPSRYLPGVRCPILFVSGTNDKAYPFDSLQKSYQLVPGQVDLCIRVGMRHGHSVGWAPVEIGLFVDSVLKQGTPLAQIGPPQAMGSRVQAAYSAKTRIIAGELHYTTDSGSWLDRHWQSAAANLESD